MDPSVGGVSFTRETPNETREGSEISLQAGPNYGPRTDVIGRLYRLTTT